MNGEDLLTTRSREYQEIMDRSLRRPGPSERIRLSEEEIRWLRGKWLKIRASQQKADEQNNKWHRLNDELNLYLDRRGETDVVQRSKTKGDSLALKDALATGKWHAEEAQRHIADVTLFLQMKDLGVL